MVDEGYTHIVSGCMQNEWFKITRGDPYTRCSAVAAVLYFFIVGGRVKDN